MSGYRVELFAEQDAVGEQAVIDLWTREGAIAPDEARRRVREVLQIATDGDGEPVGVSTAFLLHSVRLGVVLWHYRFFVAEAHRLSDIGVTMALAGRDHLESLFASGRDRRGAGLLYEIENEDLKRYRNDAHMQPTGVTFIGENTRGDHLRVRWFPGALAPASAG